jgi:hypothetical protein
MAESESVFKLEQIVCHLCKGRDCFLNRLKRMGAKELWNHKDFSICVYLKGDSKIMPHMFTGD